MGEEFEGDIENLGLFDDMEIWKDNWNYSWFFTKTMELDDSQTELSSSQPAVFETGASYI